MKQTDFLSQRHKQFYLSTGKLAKTLTLLLLIIPCFSSYATFIVPGVRPNIVRAGTTKTIITNDLSQIISVRIVSADNDVWVCLKPGKSISAFDIDCSYSACALEYFSVKDGNKVANQRLFSFAKSFSSRYRVRHPASKVLTPEELFKYYHATAKEVILNCIKNAIENNIKPPQCN